MKTLCAIIPFLALCASLHAAEVELVWDAPEEPVSGNALWKRMPDGTSVKLGTVAAPAVSIMLNLDPGRYEIYATAISAEGVHSLPSEPVTFTVPAAPKNLRIKIALQASNDMETWETVAVYHDAEGSRRFYRAVFE